MCGINVIVDKTKTSFGPETIQAMNAAIRHRGPDGDPHCEKIELDWATVWLGATRLALRGGAAGQQPMHSPSGRFTLVYNGEIYNLAQHGESDTEALAAQLDLYPPEAETHVKVNGMYAVVILDHHTQKLYAGHDKYGIKPLWLAKAEFGYILSSEIEAIAEVGVDLPLPLQEAVRHWLQKRYAEWPGSFYPNILKPWPGSFLALNDAHVTTATFALDRYTHPTRSTSPTSDLQPLMLEVLERQLASDRPVGLMLSGGYDSAFLLACLAEMGRKLPCYTLAGTPDAEPAARMATKLGFEHRLVSMPTDWRDLETYMQGKLHPIADSGGFATWLVARQARADGIPVLLSGAGADELLGGYRRHWWLQKIQAITRGNVNFYFEQAVFNWLSKWNSLEHLSKGKEFKKHYWWKIRGYKAYFDPRSWELGNYLQGDVLMVTDQATMAHGVEARVPYLDDAIVAQLMSRPWMEIMSASYKAPLVPALKEAGLFDLLLKRKTGFGLWHTNIFEGLPILERLQDSSHVLYQYLKYGPTQKALATGKPHARFSVCQLAYTLEFIQEIRGKSMPV